MRPLYHAAAEIPRSSADAKILWSPVLSQIRIKDKKAIGQSCRSRAVSRYNCSANGVRRLQTYIACYLCIRWVMSVPPRITRITTTDWEPSIDRIRSGGLSVFARHSLNRLKAPCERSPKVADLLRSRRARAELVNAGTVGEGERQFRAMGNLTTPMSERRAPASLLVHP